MTQAIQVRLEKDLKKNADKVLSGLGLDVPSAIRIFLTKVVSTNSIPFELKNTVFYYDIGPINRDHRAECHIRKPPAPGHPPHKSVLFGTRR